MRFKTTFRLFAIVCLLAGAFWLLDRYSFTTDEQQERDVFVLNTKAENIDELIVEWNGEYRVECARENGKWFIKRPVNARADESRMSRILWALENMPSMDVVTAKQQRRRDLKLDDFGLIRPRVKMFLHDRLKNRDITVLVGHDVPLSELVYIKIASRPDVMTTSSTVLEIIPDKIERMRDRTILHGDSSRTAKIEIKGRTGFIELKQLNGNWYIQQPVVARADKQKITSMLDALYTLEVKSFIWDPYEGPSDGELIDIESQSSNETHGEQYRLAADEAVASIKVWMDGDGVGRELVLGKEITEDGHEVYAKLRDEKSIYAVDGRILDIFSAGVNDLRDRNLFTLTLDDITRLSLESRDRKTSLERNPDSGWMIVEPIKCAADQQVVNELVDAITRLSVKTFIANTNLNEYGLAVPAYIIELAESGIGDKHDTEKPAANVSEAPPNQRLLVGSGGGKDENLFVCFEKGDCVMEISSEALKGLISRAADPMLYRNRTVLSLSRENVRRVTLTKKGNEQNVIRDEAGSWTVELATAGKVNFDNMNDLMFNVANLRAVRIENNDEEGNKKTYGLEPGSISASLTFTLSGDEGIRKSIIFGSADEKGDVYAMVQGQDLVFVLEKKLADKLAGDLVEPTTPEGK